MTSIDHLYRYECRYCWRPFIWIFDVEQHERKCDRLLVVVPKQPDLAPSEQSEP